MPDTNINLDFRDKINITAVKGGLFGPLVFEFVDDDISGWVFECILTDSSGLVFTLDEDQLDFNESDRTVTMTISSEVTRLLNRVNWVMNYTFESIKYQRFYGVINFNR